jgi:predicted porin
MLADYAGAGAGRQTIALRMTKRRRSVGWLPVVVAALGFAGSVRGQESSPEPPLAPAAATTEDARERERQAEEDPLAQRREQSVDAPREWEDKPNALKPYASARIRYRVEEGGEGIWGDAGSRFGVEGQYQVRPRTWLLGRVEAGLHLLDEIDRLLSPSGSASQRQRGDSVFLRLGYIGIESERLALTWGKNWSTYYQVSKFTDLFQGNGGSASGTYNASTDGGATGTGRADGVLQSRFLVSPPKSWFGLRPFQLNVQVQYDEPIPWVPGGSYGGAVGLSAVLDAWPGYSIGLAYNHAYVRGKDTPAVRAAGLDGDARALLAGLRWLSGRWHVATTLARLRDHEATDQHVYFDGWGSELYAQIQLLPRVFAVGGWNVLRPDGGESQAGKYRVQYGVLELRYAWRDFGRMVYASMRFDDGRLADGTPRPNVFTIGVRLDWP